MTIIDLLDKYATGIGTLIGFFILAYWFRSSDQTVDHNVNITITHEESVD